MRRTQLYLEDDLWNLLHLSAARSGTSISQLVRDAIRDRYSSTFEERKQAMQQFVGIRRDVDIGSTDAYVRKLRRGSRLERLQDA